MELPRGLDPECKKKEVMHFISKCETIGEDSTKTALQEDFQRTKWAREGEPKKRRDKKARIVETPFSILSSLFRASFAQGLVELNLMSDQGALANLIPDQLVEAIKNSQYGNNIPKSWAYIQRGHGGPVINMWQSSCIGSASTN